MPGNARLKPGAYMADPADVGDLVGENGGVGGSEAGHGGFACAGNTREQKGTFIAYSAGSVNQEAAFPCKNQGVRDAQDGVDGIGIGALANAAAACAGVPGGAKIAALETPESAPPGYAGFFAGWAAIGIELNFELAGGARVRVEETGVTVFQDIAELRIVGLQENGDVTDFDGYGLR
jgi:hypothetical protein